MLLQNLCLGVLFHKGRYLIHQTVRHGVMRHDSRHTDHDDLVDILLINLRRRYMELVLQLRHDALSDHSLFIQAVHPRRMQPESHCCDSHIIHLF